MNIPKNIMLKVTICALSCALFLTSSNAQSDGMDKTDMSKAVPEGEFGELEWAPCPAPLDFEGCHITVLQGVPSKPNADILFRMQPGTTAPEHWHTSAERMVLISGEMHVTYTGEETQVLKAGTYAYGPPQKPHVAKCVGDEACVLFIAFEEPVDTFVK